MHIDNKKYKIETKKNIQTKIVHISDIHYSKKYNTKILDKVRKEIEQHNPNYICITGDLIDTYNATKTKEFEYFINWLKKLSEIAKVIILNSKNVVLRILDISLGGRMLPCPVSNPFESICPRGI